jgi:hypothetical protein
MIDPMPQKKIELSKGAQKRHGNPIRGYETVLSEISSILESARRTTPRTVNAIMTAAYWQIGRRIFEVEQLGSKTKADYYGEHIIERLAKDLTARFGRGFARRNLFQMRAFYLAYLLAS